MDQSWEYINRSQTHECGNWGLGRAMPRKEYIEGIAAAVYSGRTKYSAFVSKLNKLSEEYLSPQKTQKAAVFFYSKDLRQEIDLKSEPK